MTNFKNWLRKKIREFLHIVDTSPGSVTDRLSKYGIKPYIKEISEQLYKIQQSALRRHGIS